MQRRKRFACIVTYFLTEEKKGRPEISHLIITAKDETEAWERGMKEMVWQLKLPFGYLKYKTVEI